MADETKPATTLAGALGIADTAKLTTAEKRANGVFAYALDGTVHKWTLGTAGVTVDAAKVFPQWPTLTDCQRRIVHNGIKQRVADGGAKGGQAATAQQKFAQMGRIADALSSGSYELTGANVADLVEACIAAGFGKDRAKVTAYLSAKSTGERAKIELEPKVAEQLTKIRAGRATGDGKALIGELANM